MALSKPTEYRWYFPAGAREPVTKHFTAGEYRQKNKPNEPWPVNMLLAEWLELLRDTAGGPIRITSGYRSPAYNRKIGGASKSKHMLGCAVDITCSVMNTWALAQLAYKVGFRRIGISPGFVHLDTAEGEAMWIYDRGPKSRWRKQVIRGASNEEIMDISGQ